MSTTIPTGLGKLATHKPIDTAMSEIRRWLGYLGVERPDVHLTYDPRINVAVLDFKYKGHPYEFRSTRQLNCRLNMHAISRVIEFKVRAQIMDIESFETSMSPYLLLTGGQSEGSARASAPHHGTAYATLGASETASNDELKSTYRRMVRTFHPDMAVSQEAKAEFERRLSEINSAWETIKRERGIE